MVKLIVVSSYYRVQYSASPIRHPPKFFSCLENYNRKAILISKQVEQALTTVMYNSAEKVDYGEVFIT